MTREICNPGNCTMLVSNIALPNFETVEHCTYQPLLQSLSKPCSFSQCVDQSVSEKTKSNEAQAIKVVIYSNDEWRTEECRAYVLLPNEQSRKSSNAVDAISASKLPCPACLLT